MEKRLSGEGGAVGAPSAPSKSTAEEKRLQRLEKIKKLMASKKVQGTTPVSAPEKPAAEVIAPAASSDEPKALQGAVASSTTPPGDAVSGITPAPTSPAFTAGSDAAAASAQPLGSLKDEKLEAIPEEQIESENVVDPLDVFMEGISSEVATLAEFDKNRRKRKRRKVTAASGETTDVDSTPAAPVQSITLEEILDLQNRHRKAVSRRSGPAGDAEAPSPGESHSEAPDVVMQSKANEEHVSDMTPGTSARRGVSTAPPLVSSGTGDPMSVPCSSDADKNESLNGPVAPAEGASDLASSAAGSSIQGGNLGRPPVCTPAPTGAAPDDVELAESDDVQDDEAYHRNFMAEIKRQQLAAEKAEAERLAAEEEKARAAAEAKAKAASKEIAVSADVLPEEELAVIPGAQDLAGEDIYEGVRDKKEERVEEEDDYRYSVQTDDDVPSYFELVEKVGNKKDLPKVDHSQIEYIPFRRNLYVQVREITLMKDHEVDTLRKINGGIRVRGKMCPRPIKTFYQCGLPDPILSVIEKRNYEAPFPIQMQAIPALMAGRDVIGIAETGSGKTLAYLLPMMRHILDQPPLTNAEGPVGLILAPTRELAVQIQRESNRFAKIVHLRSVAVYGGTGIGEQLSALKRGAEIVVATPGRLIDVLTINGGKVTNLKRVTMCVLDEADRMFDLGFEPQITSVMRNIRPDRQTALFSATFPPHIEALARQILRKPVEIIVGEKGRAATQIEQHVEVWQTYREKFLRLLQLLGEWNEHGAIIIFVSRQNEADELFVELLKMGYPSLVLHGGQDQTDRDFTIQDFKDGARNILIATSVAARGLDVQAVVLVINFVAPDHLEDYIHRVGRTGRAGNIGVAYTFITPEEAEKAEDLVKALKQGQVEVPASLQVLSDSFRLQCNIGMARQRRAKGFGGKGFKFTAAEQSRQQQERQKAKKDLGLDTSDQEDEVLLDTDDLDNPMAPIATQPMPGGTASTASSIIPITSSGTTAYDVNAASVRAKALAGLAARQAPPEPPRSSDEKAKTLERMKAQLMRKVMAAGATSAAAAIAAVSKAPAMSFTSSQQSALAQALVMASSHPGALSSLPVGGELTTGNVPGLSSLAYIDPATGNSVDEFDINDYPQYARFKITHKDVLHRLADACGAVMQVKGRFVPPDEKESPLMAGVKRLYIEIIGATPIVVQRAK